MTLILNRRLSLQSQLDAAKTQTERNRLGQFATPPQLATDLLQYACARLSETARLRFLDPAIGTGALYAALTECVTSPLDAAVGYEIDPHYARPTRELWQGRGLDLRLADFTQTTAPVASADKFNLIVCNPPYVRHHHLTLEAKAYLRQAVRRTTGLNLGGLTGLYGYFMLLAHAWLSAGGLAGWLIPSEFMDVNYGQPIKTYLLDQVTLLRVHRFDPTEAQFQDARVSSAVVWFENTPPPPNHAVEFTYGGTLAHPTVAKDIPATVLRDSPKWTQFPRASIAPRPDRPGLTLADLFQIQRGVATGAKGFFILTAEQVAEHRLPPDCLLPILPGPRDLAADEITANDRGEPLVDSPRFLVHCNLPAEAIQQQYPALWAYLQSGVQAGIHQQYMCQHSSPWYAPELRAPARWLCTAMSRNTAGRPFRFILNHSQATATNGYLLLYPRPEVSRYLDQPDRVRAVWTALKDIQPDSLMAAGRVYGGGLHKLEPSDLGRVSAERVLAALPDLASAGQQLSFWA